MQQLATCTSCQQPLKEIKLEGHYGQSVSADVCGNCHLVWFDAFESVRLSGLGWLGLLREMIATPRAAQNVPPAMQCVRCHGALKAVRNLTRFGRTERGKYATQLPELRCARNASAHRAIGPNA